MATVPPEQFARALQELDGPAFAALVADLWERTGWETDREGLAVVATRRGESRRLQVVPHRRFASVRGLPSVDGDVDRLVVPRRAAPAFGSTGDAFGATGDAVDGEVVDATDLRERALYALDGAARETFFQRHFGRPASDPSWQASASLGALPSSLQSLASALRDVSSSLRRLPRVLASPRGSDSPLDRARESTAVRSVAVAVLVLGLVLAVAAVAAGPLAADDPTEQNRSSSDELLSAGPGATDENDAVFDVEPTCERGPREVATTVSAALTGGNLGRGLGTYWDFANPSYKDQTEYGAFASIHGSAYESVANAERVEHGELRRLDGDRVRIDATVVHGSGETSDWLYELEQWSEGRSEGCWVVNQFARR